MPDRKKDAEKVFIPVKGFNQCSIKGAKWKMLPSIQSNQEIMEEGKNPWPLGRT